MIKHFTTLTLIFKLGVLELIRITKELASKKELILNKIREIFLAFLEFAKVFLLFGGSVVLLVIWFLGMLAPFVSGINLISFSWFTLAVLLTILNLGLTKYFELNDKQDP